MSRRLLLTGGIPILGLLSLFAGLALVTRDLADPSVTYAAREYTGGAVVSMASDELVPTERADRRPAGVGAQDPGRGAAHDLPAAPRRAVPPLRAGGPPIDTLVIARRFRGPQSSANGGYAAGLLAAFLEGPAQVTLRLPPPLERELTVQRRGEVTLLLDGDDVVAEAVAADVGLEAPAPPTLEEASARERPLRADRPRVVSRLLQLRCDPRGGRRAADPARAHRR